MTSLLIYQPHLRVYTVSLFIFTQLNYHFSLELAEPLELVLRQRRSTLHLPQLLHLQHP